MPMSRATSAVRVAEQLQEPDPVRSDAVRDDLAKLVSHSAIWFRIISDRSPPGASVSFPSWIRSL